MTHKSKIKELVGRGLNSYHAKALQQIDRIEKKNIEQNHKISVLANELDNDHLSKIEEGTVIPLENSNDGLVCINNLQGNTWVNYCKNGDQKMYLNGDIDLSGTSVSTNSTVDNGKVDVYLEGDTLVNYCLDGTKELTLNKEINVEDTNIKIEDTVDNGLVDVILEGDSLVNYCLDGSKEFTLNKEINIDDTSAIISDTVDNGLVDISLEGNTLVNLVQAKGLNLCSTSGNGLITRTEKGNGCLYTTRTDTRTYITVRTFSHKIVKPNTIYTLTFEITENTLDLGYEYKGIFVSGINDCYFGNSTNLLYRNDNFSTSVGKKVITFTTGSNVSSYTGLGFGLPQFVTTVEGMTFAIENVMLLEGDWTDKEIPEYFEGMKSVGELEDNKIEIVSRNKNEWKGKAQYDTHRGTTILIKEDNECVFEHKMVNQGIKVNIEKYVGKEIVLSYDVELLEGSTLNWGGHNRHTQIAYYIDGVNQNIAYHNGNPVSMEINRTYRVDVVLKINEMNRNYIDDYRYIGIEPNRYSTDTPTYAKVRIANFQITQSREISSYIAPKLDKKEVSLSEPLRALPNGVKDKIVKIGGKWYVERNCGEKVFSGDSSEDWSTFSHEVNVDVQGFSIIVRPLAYGNDSNYDQPSTLCDKFKVAHAHENTEHCYFYASDGSTFAIVIDKTKASDVDTFKTWLQNNNVKVTYKLATPTYEEIIDSTLTTYLNATYISNNSLIPCNMKITNTGYNTLIKPSTLYTVAFDRNTQGEVIIDLGGTKVATTNKATTITTSDVLTDKSLRLYSSNANCYNVRLLEGDKTSHIPEYFEGMNSVGQLDDNKIEVISHNNGSLSNISTHNFEVDGRSVTHNLVTPIKDGQYFKVSYRNNSSKQAELGICLLTRSGKAIYSSFGGQGVHSKVYENTTGEDIVRLRTYRDNNYSGLVVENISINLVDDKNDTTPVDYKEFKMNKKEFTLSQPLRGTGDICDRFVKINNKWYIERNCKEIEVNHYKNWTIGYGGTTGTVNKFEFNYNDPSITSLGSLGNYPKSRCNNFNHEQHGAVPDVGNYRITFNLSGTNNTLMAYVLFNIDTKEVPLFDIEAWKVWLTNNPTSIVVPTFRPTYEEIENIELSTYLNETHILNSSTIPCNMKVKNAAYDTLVVPNNKYTVIFDTNKTGEVTVDLGGERTVATNSVAIVDKNISSLDSDLRLYGDGIKVSNIRVIQYDKSNCVPRYFEGMKSVGELENNNIEIVSNNKNLFNVLKTETKTHSSGMIVTWDKEEQCFILNGSTSNDFYMYGENNPNSVNPYWINCKKQNSKISISVSVEGDYSINNEDDELLYLGFVNGTFGRLYGSTREFRPAQNGIMLHDVEKPWMRIKGGSSFNNCKIKIQFEVNSNSTAYSPHRFNKKEIQLNEPLRGLSNGIGDKFIKKGSKWYVERNCGELLLNGSESTWTFDNSSDTHSAFYLNNSVGLYSFNITNGSQCVMSDRFPTISSKYWKLGTIEGCIDNTGNIAFVIKNNRLSTVSTESFKQWLSENPIRVVYQIGTPIYESIDDPVLITYLDYTYIYNNSLIPCNMKVKNTGYDVVLKRNTLYTVIFNTNQGGTVGIDLGGTRTTTNDTVATITTSNSPTDDSLRLCGKYMNSTRVMLLEGDKSNLKPHYFSGLKSSFEDTMQSDGKYKMEILSHNKNQVDLKEEVRELKNEYFYNKEIDIPIQVRGRSFSYRYDYEIISIDKEQDDFVSNLAGSSYNNKYQTVADFDTTTVNQRLYNGAKGTVIINNKSGAYKHDLRVIRCIRTREPVNMVYKITNFALYFDDNADVYIPYESNKVDVLSISPLRGIGSVKDRFVFVEGELKIERNCGQYTIDGNHYWVHNSTRDRTMRGSVGLPDDAKKQYILPLVSDRFIYDGDSSTEYTTFVYANGAIFTLPFTDLEYKEVSTEFPKWFEKNPTSVVYILKEPYYEDVPYELKRIILGGYEDGSIKFNTNISPIVDVTYSGETPIVKATRLNKVEVSNNTIDINDNIVPYLMDMDFRVVCLQLEGGIENISMAKLFGGTYEMLQRDIQSKRYSIDEYKYRLEAYLSANKITQDEYEKLGGMLNE